MAPTTLASWTNEGMNELAKVLENKIKSKYTKLSHSALGIKCNGFIKWVLKCGEMRYLIDGMIGARMYVGECGVVLCLVKDYYFACTRIEWK